MNLKYLFCGILMMACATAAEAITNVPEHISASISLKVPGNPATSYSLTPHQKTGNESQYEFQSEKTIPVTVLQQVSDYKDYTQLVTTITAKEDIYFNYSQNLSSGFKHSDCLFYMPGFWYRKNLRSPINAPSFHTSDSWTVREDRLSSPLTGIYDEESGEYLTVLRIDKYDAEALTTHKDGEVILSGRTSIGSTGFLNDKGYAALSFGFPYQETPKTYIRKLTLAPPVQAFQFLKAGESIQLVWQIAQGKENDYSGFISKVWQYCYDTYLPQEVNTPFTTEYVKKILSNYFTASFVSDQELKYTSGVHLRTDDCKSTNVAELGFVGRVLLNAFNTLEYGEQQQLPDLVSTGNQTFDSYLEHGFTPAGFLREFVAFGTKENEVLSIRRQSEAMYAILLYLQYEKQKGRKHPEWEKKAKMILDLLVGLQIADGSFPRKFKDNYSVVDNSGGSTPSVTIPLVLGYKYFGDKKYLESAKKSVGYLEKEIISKADYFSSTLDANCEDKEASFYATIATYYLASISKGKEKEHYSRLCCQAAYFAASWYYVWDVPFAQGQMLGDMGFKTRGWGNVSVENNHVDVFIFELAAVLNWLSTTCNEPRFSALSKVIHTSMRQLLPFEGHLCGIAKTGYYPEVVQHTNWDYGKNGKGFYNDIFAPGWTVASLWELFTPNRVEQLFHLNK